MAGSRKGEVKLGLPLKVSVKVPGPAASDEDAVGVCVSVGPESLGPPGVVVNLSWGGLA